MKIVCAAIIVSMFSACGMKKVATATIGKLAVDGTSVLESEQDIELAKNSTPSLILTLEVLAKGNPNDKRMLTLLARSYGQYAFGFLEEDILKYKDTDPSLYKKASDRADLFYKRGRDYGLSALWSKKEQERVLSLPQDAFEKELLKFGKGRAGSLFWTAFCWGNFINLHRDDVLIFADISRVEAIVKRVLKLDPSFYYGSAHSFLGSIASSKPAMLGGQQKTAEDEFKAAMEVSSGYLMTKVLFAQYYAVQYQDKALFDKLLDEVKNSDANVLPEQRLANELAKRRAEILLEKGKKYF